ncbi:hypothetical protein PLICRDRAFT_212691 [Plicaturopsis crispa FD-325 SS-3]|nr:hypothetical protein PLICRDRAFT_212691 [Plicaturopsis crispa FD-325 SS-3]
MFKAMAAIVCSKPGLRTHVTLHEDFPRVLSCLPPDAGFENKNVTSRRRMTLTSMARDGIRTLVKMSMQPGVGLHRSPDSKPGTVPLRGRCTDSNIARCLPQITPHPHIPLILPSPWYSRDPFSIGRLCICAWTVFLAGKDAHPASGPCVFMQSRTTNPKLECAQDLRTWSTCCLTYLSACLYRTSTRIVGHFKASRSTSSSRTDRDQRVKPSSWWGFARSPRIEAPISRIDIACSPDRRC